jgi:SH3 domain-containing YSC84-like protein 1
MSKRRRAIMLSVLALTLVAPVKSPANPKETSASESRNTDKESERVLASANVLRELINTKESKIPEELLERAHAIAVVPNIVNAALGVGGRHGKGVVVQRLSDRRWGAPSFIDFNGGSFGFQIGVAVTDLVLVFTRADGLKGLFEDKLELGGSAGVAAGPIGRDAEAGTNLTFDSPIYSYSRSKGLFAGIALKGTVMTIDDSSNHHVYGSNVTGRDILMSGNVASSPIFAPLLKALKQETQVAKATIREAQETEKHKVEARASAPENVAGHNPENAENKTLQEALKAKGFYDGGVDGIVGPKTREALRDYQKSEGLPVTGRLDAATAEKLGVR